MLSKEEIEKAKEDFDFFNEGDYITKEMVRSKEKIFEYIEELEADNYEQSNIINDYIDERRELIEKLEEDIKNLLNQTKEKDLREKANYTLLYLSKYRKIVKGEMKL